MRYVKYLILAVVALVVVMLAVANRGPVTLHLWPEGLPLPQTVAALPSQVTLPVFVVVLAAVLIGLAVGLCLELVRESGHRREERRFKRETAKLHRENKRLAEKAGEADDDILGVGRA